MAVMPPAGPGTARPGMPRAGMARARMARPGMPRAAIFLDKDGTLLRDVPYNVDPARMRWAPGARRGLRALAALGAPLVVVSNQPGVALGRFAAQALRGVARALCAMFAQEGAALAGFYYCPHHPQGRVAGYGGICACRKPAPGLLLRAAEDLHLDLDASWMIGDILDDVQAGHQAGCRSVLLDVGNETEWRLRAERVPDLWVDDLAQAARRLQGAWT